MAMLTRDKILAAKDTDLFEVDVPEWGGTVLVKPLTGEQRDAFEASMYDAKTKQILTQNVRARVVAMACVNNKGERLFTNEDVDALGKKSGVALDRIYKMLQGESGLSESAMEKIEGNSETG